MWLKGLLPASIGAAVGDVYEAVNRVIGSTGAEVADAEPVERPTTLVGWVKFGFSSLIGVITGSMIPVIGLLAASGILKGILALLTQFNVVKDASDTYILIDAMSSSGSGHDTTRAIGSLAVFLTA